MKIILNIEVDNPEELHRVMALLATGTKPQLIAHAVDQPPPKTGAFDPVTGKTDMQTAAEPTPASAKTRAKREPAAATAPTPETKPVEETKAEPPKEQPKNGHSKKAEAAPPAGDAKPITVELPDDVKNTASMRDLLTWLNEHGGVKDVETMVATCSSLKSMVPILSKVPDVDTRVRRAVEVLGLFTAVDAG